MKFSNTQLRTILLDIFFPKGFSTKMGRLIAALSILALLSDSFYLGLSITFHMCLIYYDGLVRLLLFWAVPYMHLLTQYLSHLINLRITLSGPWHHVFVVMWILFMRDASVAFSDGRIKLSIVRGINGFCISIIFSFLASVKVGIANTLLQNMQLATLPYVGIYAYDLMMYAYSALSLKRYRGRKVPIRPMPSRWRHFKENASRAHLRFALILSAIGLCFAIPYFSAMPFPKGGLVVLAIATLVNLLYWVFRGVIYASKARTKKDKSNLQSWYSHFVDSEAGRFALAVGSVFVWILTFIVLNTGAKILGL
jgi:hypothetical protein